MVNYILIIFCLLIYSVNIFSQKIDTLHVGNKIQWYYLEDNYRSVDTIYYNAVPTQNYGYLYNEYGDSIGCYCNINKSYNNKDNILKLLKNVKINDIYLNTDNISIDTVIIIFSLNYIYEEVKHRYDSYEATREDYLIKRPLYRKLKRKGGYVAFEFKINNPKKHMTYYIRHKPKYKIIKKLNKKINRKRICLPDCKDF